MANRKFPHCRLCPGPNDGHGLCHPCLMKINRERQAKKLRDALGPCATCGLHTSELRSKFKECAGCQKVRRQATIKKQRQKCLKKCVCWCGCGQAVNGRTKYADGCEPKKVKKVKVKKRTTPDWGPVVEKPKPKVEVVVDPGVPVTRVLLPWSRWS